jgi:hypothetical protein
MRFVGTLAPWGNDCRSQEGRSGRATFRCSTLRSQQKCLKRPYLILGWISILSRAICSPVDRTDLYVRLCICFLDTYAGMGGARRRVATVLSREVNPRNSIRTSVKCMRTFPLISTMLALTESQCLWVRQKGWLGSGLFTEEAAVEQAVIHHTDGVLFAFVQKVRTSRLQNIHSKICAWAVEGGYQWNSIATLVQMGFIQDAL